MNNLQEKALKELIQVVDNLHVINLDRHKTVNTELNVKSFVGFSDDVREWAYNNDN